MPTQATGAKPAHFENYQADEFSKVLSASSPALGDTVHLVKLQLFPTEYIAEGRCDTQNAFTLHLAGVTSLEAAYDGCYQQARSGPGGLTVAPQLLPMGFRWGSPVHTFSCFVAHDFCMQVAAEHARGDPARLAFLPRIDVQDPLSEQILWTLVYDLESDNQGGRLYVESLVHTLVLHTLVHASSLSPMHLSPPVGAGLTPAQAKRVREFIAANHQREIGLAELAAALNFSPDYFLRQFKRSFGTTPHQFVIQVRLEQAKRLLEQGQLTVGEVAAEVGFYDQSHLAHHFKRAYGVAPRAFLKKNMLDPKLTNPTVKTTN